MLADIFGVDADYIVYMTRYHLVRYGTSHRRYMMQPGSGLQKETGAARTFSAITSQQFLSEAGFHGPWPAPYSGTKIHPRYIEPAGMIERYPLALFASTICHYHENLFGIKLIAKHIGDFWGRYATGITHNTRWVFAREHDWR